MRNAIYNYNARGHDLIGLMDELQQQARQKLASGKYQEAAVLYEQGIEISPEIVSNYWHLGLAQLLQGREEEAQITWMMPLLTASDEESNQWRGELLAFLDGEANSQEADGADETAWLIRQHYGEIDPEDHKNLLKLLWLALKLERFREEDGLIAQLVTSYQSLDEGEIIDEQVLRQILQEASKFNPCPPSILQLLEVIGSRIRDWDSLTKILLHCSYRLYYSSQYKIGADLARLWWYFCPHNLDALLQLYNFCRQLGVEGKWESVRLAEEYLERSADLTSKLVATHSIIASLMEIGGQFHRARQVYQLYKTFIRQLGKEENDADVGSFFRLVGMGGLVFYFEDAPVTNRPLINGVAPLGQAGIESLLKQEINGYRQGQNIRKKSGPSQTLKIGYLSECFRQHSVGWLVRWLLKYHDRSKFEVHLYCIDSSQDALQQQFRAEYGANFHYVSTPIESITNQIYEDEIDLLVDLDSLTTFETLATMAAKPAPVQISWLGCDASGLPAIDYFIADPYVLPDNAQEYYSEKIWRLPETYIAVDGFEAAVPNLSREQLDLPPDAIVYFSSQTGPKRHPDNVRLQMKILYCVPNSYFLVKAPYTDPESIASFFNQLAEEEGVSSERLRFLPTVDHEAIHRANLTIADVVLDTYPYNGATTTLETLWMGIPLVTRVGEQFAARNSYSMMINAGVKEGIAWTDEEYFEWGVRLGKDEELRQTIQWKLRQSRHTSPLWNGKQFAREMENAYQQMWWKYVNDN